MAKDIRISKSEKELSLDLADYISALSSQAISQRGLFTIALSGGSLTRILAEGLLAEPIRNQIGWDKWNVFWVDERWVPFDSPESNSGTACREVLEKLDIPQKQIYSPEVNLSPNDAAKAYQAILAKIFNCTGKQIPVFDLILLGLGEDGHTASLFPNHEILNEEDLWVVPIYDSPKSPACRITFTLPLINNAEAIAFVASGSDKAAIIPKILSNCANEPALPAELVRLVDGKLSWFIDEAAAINL